MSCEESSRNCHLKRVLLTNFNQSIVIVMYSTVVYAEYRKLETKHK